MIYVLIENGVEIATSNKPINPKEGQQVIQRTEEEQEQHLANLEATRVPESLNPRQIRLAMLGAGVSLSSIDTMIDNLTEPMKSQVKIMREYSESYHRDNPILVGFAQQLQMDDEDIDNLFIAGGKL